MAGVLAEAGVGTAVSANEAPTAATRDASLVRQDRRIEELEDPSRRSALIAPSF